MRGVNTVFNQFIYEHNCCDKVQSEVEKELVRILKLRYRSQNDSPPKRPPRILLIGPPGSGRKTQSKIIAEQFGLVRISVRDLLKTELRENPDNGAIISKCIDQGEPVPDKIVNHLVQTRLSQADCQLNGWIMDGFPESEAQVNLLKSMRIKPSVVFLLEQNEEESIRRLSNRRIDPVTGICYNIETDPADDSIATRLIEAPEDKYEVVKLKFAEWSSKVAKIEDAYKIILNIIAADKPKEIVTENLVEMIQTPS